MDPIAVKAIAILDRPIRNIDDSLAVEAVLLDLTDKASPALMDIVDDVVEDLGIYAPGSDCPGLLTEAQWATAKASAVGRLRAA